MCRVVADFPPQEVLLFTAALDLQQCPEGLGQLEDLWAWVTLRQDLWLGGALGTLLMVLAAQPHESTEQAFAQFA